MNFRGDVIFCERHFSGGTRDPVSMLLEVLYWMVGIGRVAQQISSVHMFGLRRRGFGDTVEALRLGSCSTPIRRQDWCRQGWWIEHGQHDHDERKTMLMDSELS
jgi:hypothetical protein